MTDRKARRILNSLSLRNGANIRFGVHLAGPGPARRGWARYSAAGDCDYLGATAVEVVDNALSYPTIPLDVAAAVMDAVA